jgi:hypothetical protein
MHKEREEPTNRILRIVIVARCILDIFNLLHTNGDAAAYAAASP